MSLLGELRFDDREAASYFKFKERRLPIGGLNFRIAFEGGRWRANMMTTNTEVIDWRVYVKFQI